MSLAVSQPNGDLLAALSGARTAAPVNEVEAAGQRFLKLLITQLRNQDPLNPLDNAQMTLQLAQMSTVEGINRLNAGLQALLESHRVGQTLQAAALIGRTVLVEGRQLLLGEAGATGGLELAGAAERVRVEVLDADGQTVRRLDLGALPAGVHRFAWDGQNDAGEALPAGRYGFTVSATRAGQPVAVAALALDRVAGVITGGAEIGLDLATLGRHTLTQVRQIN